MRLSQLLFLFALLVVACLSSVQAANWDKDDYEIFELQAAIEKSEGKGTTFYSVLGLTPSATQNDIKRAYRKKSLELHPDKNAGIPDIHRRFERLGLINKILRDGRKDRYDSFLSNGFPKWRGTGYFYSRYRPGLGFVLVLLILFSCVTEWLVRILTIQKERTHLHRLKRSALFLAYGPRFQSILYSSNDKKLEKKIKLPLYGFSNLPDAPDIQNDKVNWDEEEKKIRKAMSNTSNSTLTSSSNIMVDAIVEQDQVLVLDKQANEWILIDPNQITNPSFLDSWPIRLAKRWLPIEKHQQLQEQEQEEVMVEDDHVTDSTTTTSSSPSNGSTKKKKSNKKNK